MKRAKVEREPTEEERKIVVCVRHCSGELNDILQGARRKAQSNARVFSQSGVSALYRGLDSYVDMYEKLGVKSREALERLFTSHRSCEEIQDAQDAIEETEGNWRTFLRNLDREMTREQSEVYSKTKSVIDMSRSDQSPYFRTSDYPLTDMQTHKEVSLNDFIMQRTCLFITFQPAYWPDTAIRWRHAEINKVKADLSQFNIGFAIVTWGPLDVVRSWVKHLHRTVKWPVLWDKDNCLHARFGFARGLQQVWAAENLDFLGYQRAMHNRAVHPPPTDLDWLNWSLIGGEAIITRPTIWDPKLVRKPSVPATKSRKCRPSSAIHNQSDDDDDGEEDGIIEDNSEQNAIREAARDREAKESGKVKMFLVHRSSTLADLMPSGSIYQASLTCFARSQNCSEATVMDSIRQNRRFRCAPESARLQYEATTGLYYDPETSLYYDSARGYFYDSSTQFYYYWSESEHRYIQANSLIQAEMVAAQTAQAMQVQAEAVRVSTEREAARKAAQQVVAQLAEIRAGKDDYAAYAYATCVIPQQQQHHESNYFGDGKRAGNAPIESFYKNTSAAANNISKSLKSWDLLVPYTDDGIEQSSTPPPPGL